MFGLIFQNHRLVTFNLSFFEKTGLILLTKIVGNDNNEISIGGKVIGTKSN